MRPIFFISSLPIGCAANLYISYQPWYLTSLNSLERTVPDVLPVVKRETPKNYTTQGRCSQNLRGLLAANWKGIVMDNNNTNNTATGTAAEGTEKETQAGTATGTENNAAEGTVTMSKADYDKAIQAAEDRVRTKYSKDIKALEKKVAELTPVQKTEAELAIEQRIAELERKEQEADAKAKTLSLKTALQAHSLDADIADYLKTDVDADAFSAAIEKVVAARLAASGYKPTGHQTNQLVTKEEYDKMSYDERVELYRRDPEMWKRLKH